MRVTDMNIGVPVVDDRRLEIVANGLPLWHAALPRANGATPTPSSRGLAEGRSALRISLVLS